MHINEENIPALLKEHLNWVVWGTRGSPLKAPYNPVSILSGNPQFAKAGVKETWSDYNTAVECVNQKLAQGIGYQFAGNGIYGIDLDNIRDKNGAIDSKAMDIIYKLDSFTEYSPSGTGVHIIVKAPSAVITRHRKKDHFIEIYGSGRYFTITGNTCGCYKDIQTRTMELQEIYDKYLQPESVHSTIDSVTPLVNKDIENNRFLEIGLKRDRVFNALWSGERKHGNESADDIALMNKLSYWCNRDVSTMIQAFKSSPYHAQKSEAHKKKCQRSDYLVNTAKNSCATVRSTAYEDAMRYHRNKQREEVR